jgi:hypothetical protein
MPAQTLPSGRLACTWCGIRPRARYLRYCQRCDELRHTHDCIDCEAEFTCCVEHDDPRVRCPRCYRTIAEQRIRTRESYRNAGRNPDFVGALLPMNSVEEAAAAVEEGLQTRTEEG